MLSETLSDAPCLEILPHDVFVKGKIHTDFIEHAPGRACWEGFTLSANGLH
jgi:hypothetical protein